jgi:hypothetical protein
MFKCISGMQVIATEYPESGTTAHKSEKNRKDTAGLVQDFRICMWNLGKIR